MTEKQLAEFFIEQRVVEPSQAEDVLREVELNGKTVAQAMIDGGFIDEHGFYQTIANGLGTDLIDLTERDIPPEILRLIPSGLARLHGALPIEMSGTTLRVALVDPFDLTAAEDLRFALGKDIHVVVSPSDQIEDLIKQHYGTDTTSMDEVLSNSARLGSFCPSLADARETAKRQLKPKQTQLRSFASSISFFTRRSRTVRATFISSHLKMSSRSAIASMAHSTKCRHRHVILLCRSSRG